MPHKLRTVLTASEFNIRNTVGGLEIETCITVSGPPPHEDTAL
jgi:hypothetical protein